MRQCVHALDNGIIFALGAGMRMKARLLIALCLLAGCLATPLASLPARVGGPAATRVDVSKFQLGEERDSVVKQIDEPDWVADQYNRDRCEVYYLDTTAQGTFRHRVKPAVMGDNPQGAFVVPGAFPPDWWNRVVVLNRGVVFCYKNEKLVRVMAKPCPSAACAQGSPTPVP